MSNDSSANDPMNFVRNMWGNMGFTLPGMVTPSFDVEEIEKRIKDLKAVEGWLKMNLSMLQMTIQGLEMQCVTLNTVRTMGSMAGSQTPPPPAATVPFTPGAVPASAPGSEAGSEALAQAAMWPWNLMQQMQDHLQKTAAEQAAATETPEKPAPKRGKKSQ